MSTPIRISVIGAGSATFSLGLVKDICLTESLAGSEISFMDIDTERLEMIHKLGTRYADELGQKLSFELTDSSGRHIAGYRFCYQYGVSPFTLQAEGDSGAGRKVRLLLRRRRGW